MTDWRERSLDRPPGGARPGRRRRAPVPDRRLVRGHLPDCSSAAGERFVLKHASAADDWIVRATRDDGIREAWLAATATDGRAWIEPRPARRGTPYLGAAADPSADGAAILMRDVSRRARGLGAAGRRTVLTVAAADRLLIERIALLHAVPWSEPS